MRLKVGVNMKLAILVATLTSLSATHAQFPGGEVDDNPLQESQCEKSYRVAYMSALQGKFRQPPS